MAISVQGFNVGTDASFSVSNQFGDTFMDNTLGYLMDFESEAEDTVVKVTPISQGGVPVYQTLWNGIAGRLAFTRFGPTFQQLFLDQMASYHGAGIIAVFTLSLSVQNRDTSVDTFTYTGLQFTRPRFGNFRALKEVDMNVDFRASRCVGTGASQAFLTALAAVA